MRPPYMIQWRVVQVIRSATKGLTVTITFLYHITMMRTNDTIYSNLDIDLLNEAESYQHTSRRCKAVREMEFDICECDELNDILNHGLSIPLWANPR